MNLISMRSSRATSSAGGRALSSIESGEDATDRARTSLHSSHSGDYLDREPIFESGGSSDSGDSELAPEKVSSRSPVSVVWQNISVVSYTEAHHRMLCMNVAAVSRNTPVQGCMMQAKPACASRSAKRVSSGGRGWSC